MKDKSALEEIVSLAGAGKNDFIIEIGPGHGELTEKIRNENSETRIIAIERDRELAGKLREKFSGDENFEIAEGDALKLLPEIISQLPDSKIENYKIIGNIPYYITGKLLRTIGELDKKPAITVLTIQKEVAERLAAEPPRMNRLAASVQFWAEPEIAMVLPKNLFSPPPEVDSATIVLKTLPERKIKSEKYYGMVRALFSQPRKTILNNIADGLGIVKKDTEVKLKAAGIEPELRPQNISLENIIKLASVFDL